MFFALVTRMRCTDIMKHFFAIERKSTLDHHQKDCNHDCHF